MMITSNAALELCWAAIAVGASLLAIVSGSSVTFGAVTVIALAFVMFARGGMLAAQLPEVPRRSESDVVGINVIGALTALMLGGLSIAGVFPHVLWPIALLILGGLLVLEAPLESALAPPYGYLATVQTALSGLLAIVLVTMALSGHAPRLLPWAGLALATAEMCAAAMLVLRFGRRASP